MKKLFLALILIGCLVLQACSTEPIANVTTDNPEINLDLLFNTDGCKIYRFSGQFGNYNYFARCKASTGESTSVSSVQSCGKNCSRRVSTPTINENS